MSKKKPIKKMTLRGCQTALGIARRKPMHATGLANFISAIADCIEKYIKGGAVQ